MEAVLLVDDVGGQRLGVVAAVGLVLEALVGEHVGDAVELLLLAERQLEGHEARAEPRLQLSRTRWKSARGLSSLLMNTIRGMPAAAHFAQADLGADLDAVDGADDEHGEVGDRQGGVDVAGEVGVAGRVDEVDLVGLAVARRPLERGEGQRQRHRPLDLLGLGVADRGPVLDPPRPDDHAGPQEQRLDQRRLAAAAVADDGDVADLLGRRAAQILTPSG